MQGFFGVFCGICFRSNTKTMLTLHRRKGSRTISTKNQKIFFSRREFHNARIVFAEPNDQLQKQNTFFNSKDEVKLNSAKSTIWDMFGLGQESLNSVTDTVLFNIGAEDNTDTKVDHRLTAIEKKISTGPPQRGTVRNFKIIDDKDYGGESCMHVQVMREQTVGSIEHNLSGSFLRMQGSVHMPEKIIKLNQVKAGFCAIVGSVHGGAVDLRDYKGLELCVRTRKESQMFTLNLGTDSHFEDDLYQVRIKLTRGSLSATKDTYEWKLLRIPFSSFYLTARGQVREQQRGNDSLQVTSVGFLFSNPKSRVEGPISENAGEEIVDFELDLRSIRALADIRGAK